MKEKDETREKFNQSISKSKYFAKYSLERDQLMCYDEIFIKRMTLKRSNFASIL